MKSLTYLKAHKSKLLDWPKISFEFFQKMLWNSNSYFFSLLEERDKSLVIARISTDTT